MIVGGELFLPIILYMDKSFIWLNETNKCINEFTIGYMINPGLNVNKEFREKV